MNLEIIFVNIRNLQVVSNGLNVSFMWEMEIDDNEKAEALKMQFTINFSVIKEKDLDVEIGPITPYKFNFDVTNYKVSRKVRKTLILKNLIQF